MDLIKSIEKSKDRLIRQRAVEFYRVVVPFFTTYFNTLNTNYKLIELCAGNGNGGLEFSKDQDVSKVVFVDNKLVRNMKKTTKKIQKPFKIIVENIITSTPQYITSNSAVIAIHACGELTDIVLELAAKHHIPVAVMPCCYNPNLKKYNLHQNPDKRILVYDRIEDFYDTVRLQYLRECNYAVILKKIPKKITPMNNVLIGIPREIL